MHSKKLYLHTMKLDPSEAALSKMLGIKFPLIVAPMFLVSNTKMIIAAIESAMELGQGTLDAERDVLREFGNMSAPTVFFVLERLMKKGLPDRTLLSALGPGFTSSCFSLRAA